MVAELFDPAPVAPPMSVLDALARYCWGHRRIFPELVAATDRWQGGACPRIGSLAPQLDAPSFGSQWEHHDAVVDEPLGPRYRLTETGLRAAYPVSALSDLGEFAKAHPQAQWAVLLALWAGGCFTGGGDHRRQSVRRELLATVIGGAAAQRVVAREDVGRDSTQLAATATVIAAGAADRVAVTQGVDAISAVVALPVLAERGLIEPRRPRWPVTVAPEHWVQPAVFWQEIRYLLKASASEVFSDDTRTLVEWLADRRAARRSRGPSQTPTTPSGLAELQAAWRAQMVLGRLVDAHPNCFWATGSILSLRGLFVFADGNRFAGNPTSLHQRTSKGADHPAVRRTHRLPDACLWLSGDLPQQPSVFVEYEGRRSNLLVSQHVLTSLTMSAMWRKPVWMAVVATPDSKSSVIDECDALMRSAAIEAQALEWPGADVRLRIVRYADAVRHSAITGPAIWERRLHLVNGRLR